MKPDRGIIIVSGSNGRLGDAVMRRFAGRFEDVVGFDRQAPQPAPPGCVYVSVDITSDESVRDGLRTIRDHHGAHVASVIHLAAYYDFFGRPSPQYEAITVHGTGRLLRGLWELGFRVEQFVFSSTMLVHRPGEPGEFPTEDWPLEPTWAYPASKVRTEQLIRDERGDIPAVLLRISGVYDDGCHSIPLAHQIQRINERDLTSRFYSGSTAHGQAFMHMDDLVDAIERVVERRATLPRELALLLGEPEALSYDELQHTIGRLIRGARAAAILRARVEDFARPITLEMGKLIEESRGEVALSADILEYYAENAARFLAPQQLTPASGEATIESSPLGVLFGVEPWNFPYYQLARFVAPNLMAGNVVLVKHASNVPQCATAFADFFIEAGAPVGAYTNLRISKAQVAGVSPIHGSRAWRWPEVRRRVPSLRGRPAGR